MKGVWCIGALVLSSALAHSTGSAEEHRGFEGSGADTTWSASWGLLWEGAWPDSLPLTTSAIVYAKTGDVMVRAESPKRWWDSLVDSPALRVQGALAGAGSSEFFYPNVIVGLDVPYHVLHALVVDALRASPFSCALSHDRPGAIETAWEEGEGRIKGLLWWQRRWLIRTHYRIALNPDPEDPVAKSVLRIWVESEERPNAKYAWQKCDSPPNADRAALLAELVRELAGRRKQRGDEP